jgi:hypothetical protein
MRWWTTIALALLAAVGAWLAFGALQAPVVAHSVPRPVVPEVLAPVAPVIPEVHAPAAPLAETLPPDPPEQRRLACNGRRYGEGELMPKCGRG